MSIVTVGIDLAKNVFAVHGINEAGKPALIKPSVARGKLLPRDRVQMLLDPGTPFLELAPLAALAMYPDRDGSDSAPRAQPLQDGFISPPAPSPRPQTGPARSPRWPPRTCSGSRGH